MNKKIFTLAFLLLNGYINAQVGVGTLLPNSSSELEVVSTNKGILIPRIPLFSTTDISTISNGNVNSLLVFNTSSQNDVTPGYYYWFEDKWLRIVNINDFASLDKNNINELLKVENGNLILTDTENNQVQVPILDLNIPSQFNISGDGSYTYVNELGESVTFNVIDDVIGGFNNIIENPNILNQLIENLKDSYVGGNIVFNGSEFNIIKEDGSIEAINIKDLVRSNETLTTIVDNNNGTFTYYNESSFDENGLLKDDAEGIVFNANTLSIQELGGVYTFKDKSNNVLASIDTNATAITFNDEIVQLGANNVQDAIELVINRINEIEDNKGDLSGTGILINGNNSLSNALLQDVVLSLADDSITATKINEDVAGNGLSQNITTGAIEINPEITAELLGKNLTAGDNSIIVTNGEGAVLIDSNIKVADGGITNTKLAPNSITSDKIVDRSITGLDIAKKTVTSSNLDATGEMAGNVATVNPDGSVSYSTPVVSSQNITHKGDLTSALNDHSITVTNGSGTTLVNTQLSVSEGGISTNKIAENAVTNTKLSPNAVTTDKIEDGTITGQDIATTTITSSNLNASGEISGSVATVNADGTVSYLQITPSSITDKKTLSGEGITVTQGSLVGDSTFVANSILENVTLGIANKAITTDKLDDQSVITGKLADESVTTEKLADDSITTEKIENLAISTDKIDNAAVTTEKLADESVTTEKLADESVTTEKIAEGSITSDKLNAGNASVGQVATVGENGTVSYSTPTVEASNVTAAGSIISSDISIVGGDNSTLKDVELTIKANAINTNHLFNESVTTDKIANGTIKGEDIDDKTITASNLDATGATPGSVATVNANGSVSYLQITPSSLTDKKTLSGEGITVTLGNTAGNTTSVANSILENVTLGISDDAITKDKIHENIAGDGLTQNANGSLEVRAFNGLKLDRTSQENSQYGDSVKLGGNLVESTSIVNNGFELTIETGGTNTAISGLPIVDENEYNENNGVGSDKMVVADDRGILRLLKASMPKFFYMPSILLPTAVDQIPDAMSDYIRFDINQISETEFERYFTVDLHGIYSSQFGNARSNNDRTTVLPILPPNELDYYITFFDDSVFEIIEISNDGKLKYSIKDNADIFIGSFMNIVFAVKPEPGMPIVTRPF